MSEAPTIETETQPETIEATPVTELAPTASAALTRDDDRALLDLVTTDPSYLSKAEQVVDTRVRILQRLRVAAIMRTEPADWVLNKGRDGSVTAMLCRSGAEGVGEIYGISVGNYRPMDANGVFRPEEIPGENGELQLVGWCSARSAATGATAEIEARRSSEEGFTGRKVATKATKSRLVERGDLHMSLRTTMLTKAVRVLASFSNVSEALIAEVWKGSGKKTDHCRKGQGFGSSTDRRNAEVSTEDTVKYRSELRTMLLQLSGGDIDEARQILVEITKSAPGAAKEFRGWESVDKMSQDWQFKNAWKALSAHEFWGKDLEIPAWVKS